MPVNTGLADASPAAITGHIVRSLRYAEAEPRRRKGSDLNVMRRADKGRCSAAGFDMTRHPQRASAEQSKDAARQPSKGQRVRAGDETAGFWKEASRF